MQTPCQPGWGLADEKPLHVTLGLDMEGTSPRTFGKINVSLTQLLFTRSNA